MAPDAPQLVNARLVLALPNNQWDCCPFLSVFLMVSSAAVKYKQHINCISWTPWTGEGGFPFTWAIREAKIPEFQR